MRSHTDTGVARGRHTFADRRYARLRSSPSGVVQNAAVLRHGVSIHGESWHKTCYNRNAMMRGS